MSNTNFYHIKKDNLYSVLGKLLEKSIEKNEVALIRTGSQFMTDEIDEILWSQDLSSFIPHSKLNDQDCNLNPIHITHEEDNPNNAQFLFIVDKSKLILSEISNFKKTLILFDDTDQEFIESAFKLWNDLKKLSAEPRYWTQQKIGWKLKDLE